MKYEDAERDVLAYLTAQDDDYFAERGRTKEEVLGNKDLIERIASEHLKCVNSFGNDRDWSCIDACDNDPGFYKEDLYE